MDTYSVVAAVSCGAQNMIHLEAACIYPRAEYRPVRRHLG